MNGSATVFTRFFSAINGKMGEIGLHIGLFP